MRGRERDRPHWVERAGTPLTTTGAERAKEAREGRRKEEGDDDDDDAGENECAQNMQKSCARVHSAAATPIPTYVPRVLVIDIAKKLFPG